MCNTWKNNTQHTFFVTTYILDKITFRKKPIVKYTRITAYITLNYTYKIRYIRT